MSRVGIVTSASRHQAGNVVGLAPDWISTVAIEKEERKEEGEEEQQQQQQQQLSSILVLFFPVHQLDMDDNRVPGYCRIPI